MASATSTAVFAIVAKDAASSVMGKIGKSMGRLRSAAGAAFSALATGAAAAATAIAGLAIASIKAAAEDEKAQVRLIATLRARGLATEKNIAAIDKAIEAGAKLAFTDDDVRTSIETATQFTNKFNKALKIHAVAQDVAVAKGISLEQATALVGKAFAGTGRGMKNLGIELQKTVHWTEIKEKKDRKGVVTEEKIAKSRKETIKGMEALNLITEKYGGIAAEVGDTVAVRFESAQIRLNEAVESMGAKLLPLASDALNAFSSTVIPFAEQALGFLGDKIVEVVGGLTAPGGMVESIGAVVGEVVESFKPELEAAGTALGGLFDSVSKLIGALWGDGEGALAFAFKALGFAIEAAFALAKPFFDALTWLVNNITNVVNALNKVSGAESQAKIRTSQDVAAASNVFGMGANTGGGGGFTANLNVNLDGKTIAQSTDSYLGRAYSYGGSRTNP